MRVQHQGRQKIIHKPLRLKKITIYLKEKATIFKSARSRQVWNHAQ